MDKPTPPKTITTRTLGTGPTNTKTAPSRWARGGIADGVTGVSSSLPVPIRIGIGRTSAPCSGFRCRQQALQEIPHQVGISLARCKL